MPNQPIRWGQRGSSLLEVLITIVILAIGLLGLAGLQARLQVSEMEAYQRAQALILLNDMASRIAGNRANAANYVTGAGNPLGVGGDCPAGGMRHEDDARDWCLALQGAGETSEDYGNVGAMVGGRGCVVALPDDDVPGERYLVTVAWQGLTPVSVPAAACGQGLYDGGANCTGDLCRRTVNTVVRIGNLRS